LTFDLDSYFRTFLLFLLVTPGRTAHSACDLLGHNGLFYLLFANNNLDEAVICT